MPNTPNDDPYAPPAWPGHADLHAATPPAKKRRRPVRTVLLILGSFLGLFVVIGILAAATGATVTRQPTMPSGGTITPPSATSTAPFAPVQNPPAPADFTLTLKTISKTCFGSAGCVVTVQPVLDYHGAADITVLACEITYNITGGTDGGSVATLHANGVAFPMIDTTIQTPSSKTKLGAAVTDVACN